MAGAASGKQRRDADRTRRAPRHHTTSCHAATARARVAPLMALQVITSFTEQYVRHLHHNVRIDLSQCSTAPHRVGTYE